MNYYQMLVYLVENMVPKKYHENLLIYAGTPKGHRMDFLEDFGMWLIMQGPAFQSVYRKTLLSRVSEVNQQLPLDAWEAEGREKTRAKDEANIKEFVRNNPHIILV